MDYADTLRKYTEVTRPGKGIGIKLGTKNQAKLDKIRRLSATLKGGRR